MPGVISLAKAVILTIIIFQCIILVLRISNCRRKLELFWFLLIYVCLGAYILLGHLIPAFFSLLLLWSLGSYFVFIYARKIFILWHIVYFAALVIFFLCAILGFYGTLPFILLFLFAVELIAVYPLMLLFNAYRKSHSNVLLALLLSVTILHLFVGYDFLAFWFERLDFRAGIWSSFLFLLVSGYMLAQEGYLAGIDWQGLYTRVGIQEKELRSTYSRLIQTENTLLLQDRLIASGILAAGAAHELKNTLSAIQTSTEYGLKKRDKASKNESLQLILEHVELGKKTASEYLDQLISKGEEEAKPIRLREDLKFLLGLVRSSLWREGIRVASEIDPELCIYARKGEVEQVLLNLIRNAIDSLNRMESPADRHILIRAKGVEDSAVIDVIDQGGGVSPAMGNRIFDHSVSGKDSTGLGLYLAGLLVSRNNGTIEYVPVEGGSCFRMVFPRYIDDSGIKKE